MTATSQLNVRVRTLLVSALALLAAQLGCSSLVRAAIAAPEVTGSTRQISAPAADMSAAGHGAASSATAATGTADAGAVSASEGASAPVGPATRAGCSTVSDGRTAARAFWAVVVIALLLAQSHRHRRRRPRGVTPSRRFRI